ncbi:hypothetical protein [Streptomyces sp. HUAS ZL42]|uniref:hypothetical protein n=1 Tax=Streptomyces sp. HUAS ZL42 TaxID=3231715 RepID=UPI00345E34CA
MSSVSENSLARRVFAVYTRQAPAFQPRSPREVNSWAAGIDQLLEQQAARERRAAQERGWRLEDAFWVAFMWRPRPYGRWVLTTLVYAFAWGIPALALSGTARTVALLVVTGIAALHFFLTVALFHLLDTPWTIRHWLRTWGIGNAVGGPGGREGTHPETEST